MFLMGWGVGHWMLAGVLYAQTLTGWQRSVEFGLAGSTGNSESWSLWLATEWRYQSPGWEGVGRGRVLYQVSDRDSGVDRQEVDIQVMRSVHRRLYVTTTVQGERDDRAGIYLRIRLGPGLGYRWLQTDRTRLETALSLGYMTAQMAYGRRDRSISAWVTVRLDHRFSDRLHYQQENRFVINPADWHNVQAYGTSAFEFQFHRRARIKWTLAWRYQNLPPPDRVRHDLATTTTLVIQW